MFLKSIFSFVFCISLISSVAQPTKIEGQITGNQYQWVKLEAYEGYKLVKIDSAWCNQSGNFSLEFNPTYLGLYRITTTRGRANNETQFFDLLVDGNPIQFSTYLSSMSDSLTFINSPQQAYFQKFVEGISLIKWKQYLLDDFLLKYPIQDPFYPKAAEAYDRIAQDKAKYFGGFSNPKYPLANRVIQMAEPFEFTDMRNPSVKGAFMKDMDFSNPLLMRTNLLAQKIGEYYQHFGNQQSNPELAAVENKNFIDQVLDPMRVQPALWDNTFEYLANAFKSMKNDEALEYLKQKFTDLGGCEDDQQAKTIDDLLASFNALRPGNSVIPFVLPNHKGQNFQFPNEVLGSPVTLLIFWSTGCSHCMSTLPYWEALWRDYKGKGLKIVAVAMDATPTKWQKEISAANRDWIHLIDKKGWEGIARDYNINATPSYILMDAEGRVIQKPHNPDQIRDWLKQYYKG